MVLSRCSRENGWNTNYVGYKAYRIDGERGRRVNFVMQIWEYRRQQKLGSHRGLWSYWEKGKKQIMTRNGCNFRSLGSTLGCKGRFQYNKMFGIKKQRGWTNKLHEEIFRHHRGFNIMWYPLTWWTVHIVRRLQCHESLKARQILVQQWMGGAWGWDSYNPSCWNLSRITTQ